MRSGLKLAKILWCAAALMVVALTAATSCYFFRRESCLQYDASGECLVRCNIWDRQGHCQHACTKGLPCD